MKFKFIKESEVIKKSKNNHYLIELDVMHGDGDKYETIKKTLSYNETDEYEIKLFQSYCIFLDLFMSYNVRLTDDEKQYIRDYVKNNL